MGRGNVCNELKRHVEAFAAYDKALAIKPDFAEAWIGRGNIYRDQRNYDEALAAQEKALVLKPGSIQAWLARGIVLSAMGRKDEAIADYRRALNLGGNPESLQYQIAALGGAAAPAAMPVQMVAKLFDQYAATFDEHLTGTLKYHVPTVLSELVKRLIPSGPMDILDLGCGTGLVGKQVHPLARTLTGVDLSANMLARAEELKIYDHLICSDIDQFLQTQDRTFDIAFAADVFVYIGDLSPIFRGARQALREGGLFCFSVEGVDSGNFVLRSTLRYAHSVDYLQQLAKQNEFVLETIAPHAIRQEHELDVSGYLAIMRCK
ncbi:MAG TPA: tetratricopeptide repeat protein, partial [Nitrososphaera sp.]|nr:tetratricopeptide repeat protein [Nitrososphaera sp.]